jgi:hypothetical protein
VHAWPNGGSCLEPMRRLPGTRQVAPTSGVRSSRHIKNYRRRLRPPQQPTSVARGDSGLCSGRYGQDAHHHHVQSWYLPINLDASAWMASCSSNRSQGSPQKYATYRLIVNRAALVGCKIAGVRHPVGYSSRKGSVRRGHAGVWWAMLEDRNRTSHPYTERLAGRSTNASRRLRPRSLDRLSERLVRVQIDRCRSAGASATSRR